MDAKNKNKKVEEDMIMSVPPEGSGGMPGSFHNFPGSVGPKDNMDTFSLLGPGGTGKKKKKRGKRKKSSTQKRPVSILTFDQFFKVNKK